MSDVIKGLLVRLKRADETQKEVGVERKEAHDALITQMKESGVTSISGEDGPDDVKGTLVGGTTITIDQDRLRKALGAAQFDALCSKVLDREKLQEAIVQGKVDPVVVAKCSDEKDRAAFVKLTVHKNVRKPVVKRKTSQAGKAVRRG